MAVGDIYLSTIEFTYQNNPNAYHFHLKVTTEGDPDNTGTHVAQFGQARTIAYQALHNTFVDFQCATARQIWPNKSVPEVVITNLSGNRTTTGPITLPGQCSCVVTLYGDPVDPTKHNRGRDFWTGQLAQDQELGLWDHPAAYLQEVCDWYAAMGNTYTNGGNVFDIGIFSPTEAKRSLGPPPDPTVVFFWKLQKIRAKQLVRTQRRRQPEDPCEVFCDADLT